MQKSDKDQNFISRLPQIWVKIVNVFFWKGENFWTLLMVFASAKIKKLKQLQKPGKDQNFISRLPSEYYVFFEEAERNWFENGKKVLNFAYGFWFC